MNYGLPPALDRAARRPSVTAHLCVFDDLCLQPTLAGSARCNDCDQRPGRVGPTPNIRPYLEQPTLFGSVRRPVAHWEPDHCPGDEPVEVLSLNVIGLCSSVPHVALALGANEQAAVLRECFEPPYAPSPAKRVQSLYFIALVAVSRLLCLGSYPGLSLLRADRPYGPLRPHLRAPQLPGDAGRFVLSHPCDPYCPCCDHQSPLVDSSYGDILFTHSDHMVDGFLGLDHSSHHLLSRDSFPGPRLNWQAVPAHRYRYASAISPLCLYDCYLLPVLLRVSYSSGVFRALSAPVLVWPKTPGRSEYRLVVAMGSRSRYSRGPYSSDVFELTVSLDHSLCATRGVNLLFSVDVFLERLPTVPIGGLGILLPHRISTGFCPLNPEHD